MQSELDQCEKRTDPASEGRMQNAGDDPAVNHPADAVAVDRKKIDRRETCERDADFEIV